MSFFNQTKKKQYRSLISNSNKTTKVIEIDGGMGVVRKCRGSLMCLIAFL